MQILNYRYIIFKNIFDTDIYGLCNLCLPGDEYHYVLICPFLTTVENVYNRPKIIKFNILLRSSNKKNMCKFDKFTNIILKQF